jgi:hypothetical protein
MADVTDRFYNAGLKIEFYHIPSKRTVSFKAFLKAFSDSYNQSWESETVFGRNDPYRNFKNTERTINLSWVLTAGSLEEAIKNMKSASTLATMTYPSYTAEPDFGSPGSSATAIQQSPFFKLKFLNLIQNSGGGATKALAAASTDGLPGIIEGELTLEHNVEMGYFFVDGNLYPKEINLACVYKPMHSHPLGFKKGGFRSKNFPYGIYTGMDVQETEETEGIILSERTETPADYVLDIYGTRDLYNDTEEEAESFLLDIYGVRKPY